MWAVMVMPPPSLLLLLWLLVLVLVLLMLLASLLTAQFLACSLGSLLLLTALALDLQGAPNQ